MFVVATTNLSLYCSHFEWPEIWHADVSWPLQNWLDFGHHLLIIFILSSFWLSETGQICHFRTFSGKRKGGMAWTLACWCILTTFRTYSDFGHGLLIFLILSSFWLCETGQIGGFWGFSSECMGGMAWNLTCRCILTALLTAYILVIVCWFSSFQRYFDLVKQIKFAIFGAFSWECISVWNWNWLN